MKKDSHKANSPCGSLRLYRIGIQNMYEQFSWINAWREEFDAANVKTKKMILARIIEKITIEKGYRIHIHFYLTREELIRELQPGEVEISEAKSWYLTGT